jgi:hypothetical protein
VLDAQLGGGGGHLEPGQRGGKHHGMTCGLVGPNELPRFGIQTPVDGLLEESLAECVELGLRLPGQ